MKIKVRRSLSTKKSQHSIKTNPHVAEVPHVPNVPEAKGSLGRVSKIGGIKK